MKKNLFFTAALAAFLVGCANEDVIENASLGEDKLGTLIDAPVLGINAGLDINSRAYVEETGKPGTWVWLPTMDASNIKDVDKIGLCWTGVNNNGVYGGPLAETGDMVYTNVKFEHIGWLYENEKMSKFHCGDLTNGEYTGWMDYTTNLATYSAPDWTATEPGKTLDLGHGLFQSQNGTIYQGEYIVYFPYNDAFWNSPVTAVQERIMDVTMDGTAIKDQRELMSKYAFNVGYKSSINGGAEAEDFSTKLLSSGIQFEFETNPDFDEIVLWAKGGQKAFLTRQALSAKKIKELYNSKLTTDIYLNGDKYANEASSTMVIKTPGLNSVAKLVVPFLPNTFNELHVMFVNNTNGTVADMNLGKVTFEPGKINKVTRYFAGNTILKYNGTDYEQVATFTKKNYAYDEASFVNAYTKALNADEDEKKDENTVMLLDDIELTSNQSVYAASTSKVFVVTDETMVEGKNTLTLAANSNYEFNQTSFEVDIETEAWGCCNTSAANLYLQNSETVDGASVTMNGGRLELKGIVNFGGDVLSKYEGVDEEGNLHNDRIPEFVVRNTATVTATSDVLVEGKMTIQKGNSSYAPGKFILSGADMILDGELTVEGEGTSGKDAELVMEKNGANKSTFQNNGIINNRGSIDNNSGADTFVNGTDATFIDYVGSSLSGHRLVNKDATSEFISEVNSLVRYNNAIDLEGVRPTTTIRFVYGTSVNIGGGAFITEYALTPNKDGGIYRPYPAGGVDKLIDFESAIDNGNNLILKNDVDEEGEAIAVTIGNMTVKSGQIRLAHPALTIDGNYIADGAENTGIWENLIVTGNMLFNNVSGNVALHENKTLKVGEDIVFTSVGGKITFRQNSIVEAKNLTVAKTNTLTIAKNQVSYFGKGLEGEGVITNNGVIDIVTAVSGSDVPAKVWCNDRQGDGTYPNGKPQYYAK